MTATGPAPDATRGRWIIAVRYGLAGAMLVGVVAYLMVGEDKGAGIFAALIAVLLTRLLVLGTGEPGDREQ